MKYEKFVSMQYKEESDEWIESYDSHDTDDDDDIALTRKPKLTKKKKPKPPSSSESDEPEETEELDNEDKLKRNAAWADAMTKVLRTKKSKKFVVLAKAKKIMDAKTKKPKLEFEIVGEEQNHELESENEDEKPSKLLIKDYQIKGRVKPSVLEKDRERTLMKIATRGVVQLFNAVRQQQKTVDKTLKKAGRSHVKKEKLIETIDKKHFLNVLTGSTKSIPVTLSETKSEEYNNTKPSWSVLRDDFMMGAKLKDWDKNDEV